MSTSTTRWVVISVRLMDGRYHGTPEWPPAPARLFQALVSSCNPSANPDAGVLAVLRWLESLPAPVIASPHQWLGQEVKLWVPNNDLDSVGGDPSAVASIRTAKLVRPRLINAEVPLIYAWPMLDDVDAELAAALDTIVRGLYQFGRGVDMAWATAEVLDDAAFEECLGCHPGQVFRASDGRARDAVLLDCPRPGSLDSLNRRYDAMLRRFHYEHGSDGGFQIFQQAPKARFTQVAYDSAPQRQVLDLRSSADSTVFAVTKLTEIAALTELVRDAAAARLLAALPAQAADIERVLVGRRVEGSPSLPVDERVRLMPLPSIGHVHADRGIRRLLLEVPSGGPLRPEDLFWAFSGLTVQSPGGASVVLVQADDEGMVYHYGLSTGLGTREGYRTWRTVTPAALPTSSARRRIDPNGGAAEHKDGAERSMEEARAVRAVGQALRHAGVRGSVEGVRVQREPFEGKGARAEAFAPNTRFAKERLWHVELALREPISGPVVLGDGRFLGLGIMAPVRKQRLGILAFDIVGGLSERAEPQLVTEALRRAVMARYQASIGPRRALPPFVTGHDHDGSPADERNPHLAFVFDPNGRRLLVLAPHVRERRDPTGQERRHLATLDQALVGFSELRAGKVGCLRLQSARRLDDDDGLFAPSRRWVSRTLYVVNRHIKHATSEQAVVADLEAACRACGLPTPRVVVLESRGVPALGVASRAQLIFDVAVPGPLLLGRTRHRGGGLFGHPLSAADDA